MQYTLIDLLAVDHILTRMEAQDSQEVIQQLAAPLVLSGHVAAEFAADVWKREQIFPTGLPTQPLAVAIPHADPDHVHQSAVGIGILKTPVSFAQMGSDGSEFLDVFFVFLLAIKEQEKQVEMIQQLMKVIQNAKLLGALSTAQGPGEVLNQLKASL